MVSPDGALPESFLDPAILRTEQIERALGGVTKAISLELADFALDPQRVDDGIREKLQALGRKLVGLSEVTLSLADDIANVAGQERQDPVKPATVSQRHSPIAGATRVTLSPPAPVTRTNGSRLDTIHHADEKPDRPTGSRSRAGTRSGRSRSPEQFEGELYTAIVSPDKTPAMELRPGMTPVPITVVAEDTLNVNGALITLSGDRLYLFNALMLLRDNAQQSSALRELGFRPGATGDPASAFNKAMGELMREVNQAAGVEVIKKLGKTRTTRYCVNPAVVLHDERSNQGPALALSPNGVKKN